MKPTFIQFANTFFKVNHYKWGLIPYQAFRHHVELSQLYENNRFVIVKKYRNGGFTTLSALWCLWKIMTNEKFKTLIISNTERIDTLPLLKIIRYACDNLPEEIKLKAIKHNDHELTLENDSTIKCLSRSHFPQPSLSQNVIIFEEPAFYSDFENIYNSILPCIEPTNGQIFLVSNVNKQGYFYDIYKNAVLNQNAYYAYAPCSLEFHSNSELTRYERILGHKNFVQEYLGEFLD